MRRRLDIKFVGWVIFALLLLSFMFSADPALADQIDLNPALDIYGGYDDNILFDQSEPLADYYTAFRPSIFWGIKDLTYSFELLTYSEIIRYKDEDDFNTDNYFGSLKGVYQISKLVSLNGNVSYLKDTTLDSELEETGRVLEREERDRFNTEMGISYTIDPKSEIDVDFQYTETNYELEDSVDRQRYRFRMPYSRWLRDRLDRLVVRPGYTRVELDNDREIDRYNLILGWVHIFSDTLTFRNFIGYDYAVTKESDGESLDRGGNVDMRLTHTGETLSTQLGIRMNLEVDANGDLNEVDRIYCDFEKKLSERLNYRLAGRINGVRETDEYDQFESVYYDVLTGLGYQLNEKYTFNLDYRYSYENDILTHGQNDKVRNIIQFSLIFQFPRQY